MMEHLQKIEKLANEMIKYLKKQELFHDTSVYFNSKRIKSSGEIEEDIDVTKYIEYCNPEAITMTFEGPLYMHMNGHIKGSKVYEKLNSIANKYGYYLQPGHAWSFTLYE